MNKKAIAGLVGAMLGAAVVAAPAHAQDVKLGLMAAISGVMLSSMGNSR